jgi:hypothetical protein
MNVNLPPPPLSYNPGSFAQILDALKRSFLLTVSKDEAAPRVLLQAPNGKVYQVTVSNAGVLTVALNDGKDRV